MRRENKKVDIMFKSILIILSIFLLLPLTNAETLTFDNQVKYDDSLLKVEIVNTFGLGEIYGSLELTSHKSVDEIRKVGYGNYQPVMYYDFYGWDLYENGLGNVYFTDMKTGEEVDKLYYFAEWKEKTRKIPVYSKPVGTLLKNGTTIYESEIIDYETETYWTWEKYNSKDIPETKTQTKRIALMVYVEKDDYTDAVWTVAGKRIKEHASWSASIENGIQAYYTFDGTYGIDQDDDYYATYNATSFNGAGSTTGIIGSAYDFELGDNDYIDYPTTFFNAYESDFSYSFWVKPETCGYSNSRVIFKGGSYSIQIYGDEIREESSGGSANQSCSVGVWQHIVVTYDFSGTTYYMYKNGNIAGVTSGGSSSPTDNANALTLGNRNDHIKPYDGVLDEVGFWNRILTDQEIQDLYNSGAGLQPEPLVTDAPPSVVINSPDNYDNLTTSTQTFEAVVTDDLKVQNVSLMQNGTIVETNTSNVNGTYIFTKSDSAGFYNWSIIAYDNNSQVNVSDERFYTINIISPEITLYCPPNNLFTNAKSSWYDEELTSALENSLITYWKLDENEDLYDSIGCVKAIVGSGVDTGVSGKIRNGINITTHPYSTSNVLIGSTGNPTIQTYSLWFNLWNATNKNKYLFFGGGVSNNQLALYIDNNGYLTFKTLNNLASGPNVTTTTFQPAVNTWYNVIFSYGLNATYGNHTIYVNGVLQEQEFYKGGGGTIPSSATKYIGSGTNQAGSCLAEYDEVMVWNRLLTSTEVSNLYSSQNTFTPASEDVVINFKGDAWDDFGVENVSWYLDGVLQETNTSGLNNTNYTFTDTFTDGTYDWYYKAYDNDSNPTDSVTRTFTIDTTSPVISGTNLTNDSTQTLPIDTYWNFNASDANIDYCYYNTSQNTTYTIVTCNSTIETQIVSEGDKDFYYCANDSAGQETCKHAAYNLFYYAYDVTQSETSLGEGNDIVFRLYVNSTDIPTTTAYLIYNNTNYSVPIRTTTDDYVLFQQTVTIPEGWGNSTGINQTANWSFTISGYSRQETKNLYNTVYSLNFDNCGSNSILIYNFTVVDEDTQVMISPNSSWSEPYVEVYLEFKKYANSVILDNISESFNGTNPIQICSNFQLEGNNKYSVYGVVSYEVSDGVNNSNKKVKEFYNIQNFTIQNSTMPQHINLYDLSNETSTTFDIYYKDENLNPVEEAIIQIQRFYIEEGIYKVVEIPITDSSGHTLAHLVEEDVIYNFWVYEEGILQASFTDRVVKCESSALDTCEIKLNAQATTEPPSDFTILDNLAFTFSWNKTARTASVLFNVLSGSATMVLNGTVKDVLACSDSETAVTDTLTCTIPGTYDNVTATIKLWMDGVEIGTAYVDLEKSSGDVFGGSRVFLILLLYLTIFGLALSDNPMITGFMFLIGAILGVLINVVDTQSGSKLIGLGATFLWFAIAIIIVLVKAGRRS